MSEIFYKDQSGSVQVGLGDCRVFLVPWFHNSGNNSSYELVVFVVVAFPLLDGLERRLSLGTVHCTKLYG